METKIIDNFIEDKELLTVLQNELLHISPHFFQEKMKKGYIYSTDLPMNEIVNRYLFYKFCKHITQNVELIRFHINVQHQGMFGDFHNDPGDVTGILMLKGSGSFEFKDGKEIGFVSNRLIIFDAKKVHRGHPPVGNDPRITLAIKVKFKND